MPRPLSNLEKKIIEDILSQKNTGKILKENAYPTVAYAVWQAENGSDDIDFGPVRWGNRNNIIREDGSQLDSLSCSPFPGAWAMIPVDKIIHIRHWRAF